MSIKILANRYNGETHKNTNCRVTSVESGGTDEGRTDSHEQLFFACELGTADEGECGGRWNQLLCYP